MSLKYLFAEFSAEIKERLLDYIERYTMTLLYRILFCSAYTTDEEKDLAIQNRYVFFLNQIRKSNKNRTNFYISQNTSIELGEW